MGCSYLDVNSGELSRHNPEEAHIPPSQFLSLVLPFLSFSLYKMLSRRALLALSVAFNAIGSSAGRHLYNTTQILGTQTLDSPYPYEFPVLQDGVNASSGQFPMPTCNGFTLEEATIDQMQEALSQGRLTSVQIVMCYIQRIWQTDEYIR